MSSILSKIGTGFEKLGSDYTDFQNAVKRINTIEPILNDKISEVTSFRFRFPHAEIRLGDSIIHNVSLESTSESARMFEANAKIKRLQVIESNLIKMKNTVENYKPSSNELKAETASTKQKTTDIATDLLSKINQAIQTLADTPDYKKYRDGKELEARFFSQFGLSSCDSCETYKDAFRRLREARVNRPVGAMVTFG